ncbi:ATP-binding protein [Sulfuritalea sp.]|uniref:ATP-binding protein n=1 Tax=Sulfuritalea sp. TaxID=2480090 RepID=UPI00286DDD06|nr:ATP-binding protein [Sulfuritalea sp.]
MHSTGRLDENEMQSYLPRTLETFIVTASRQFPVLMLTGPRQVGKTTLLRALCEREATGRPPRRYVTLDNPLLLSLAREEPALFLQRFPPPVLIDEIQYAPGLLPLIKEIVDTDGGKGLVWLTGSQPFHLMQNVSESLAGRVAVMHLQGLSLVESLGLGAATLPFLPGNAFADKPAQEIASSPLAWVFERIWRGGFPALYAADAADRDLFFGSYLQTYLQRDVRDLAQVGDLMAFTRFLRSAAARTAQLLNIADMARDVGVAPNTARHWLSILQASGLVWLLEPYHTNLSKRLVKTPKMYFLDSGLAAYLTEWSSPETLEAGAMSGAVFETWVLAEMLKSYWHNGKQAPFYYYRDKDQKEIDVLIVRDGRVHPVEIKKTGQPWRDAVRHFAVLKNLGLTLGPGAVVCLCNERLPLTSNVEAIPAWQIG